MTVSFDMSEVSDLAADLDRAGTRAGVASETDMTVIAAKMAADARSDVKVDTGETKASIRVQGGKGYRKVIADSRGAFFQEFGTSATAPHSFMWKQAPVASERLAKALQGINPFD